MVSKLVSLFAGGALLCGCAANSGVVSTGQNTFVVSPKRPLDLAAQAT
jgi:hypothetical protein